MSIVGTLMPCVEVGEQLCGGRSWSSPSSVCSED